MSRPLLAKEANVNLSASVPYESIPCGYSFFVFFLIFSAISGCIRSDALLFIRSSNLIPSIKSIGSIILPFDLDIFFPDESLTKP